MLLVSGALMLFVTGGGGSSSNVCAQELAQDAAQTNQAESPLPPTTSHVNDYAHLLDQKSRRRLEETLTRLEQRSGIFFAVAILHTTGSQPLMDYSLAVSRGWGLGGLKKDSLLLLVATKDRQWLLHESQSLEADLAGDEVMKLDQMMTPLFRKGHYQEGVTKYINAVVARLALRRGISLDQ